MPNPDQMRKAKGAPEPQKEPDKGTTPSAAPAATDLLGLKESDVSPASIGAPRAETNPMPNTNPAAQLLGLGETDVAPGGPAVAQQANMQAAKTPAAAPMPVKAVEPVAQPGPAPKALSGAGTPTAEVTEGNPVAQASSKPGFWQQALDVAGKAGKSLIELIGDFAAGYSHQQSSPTEQRLTREHELRMQGNENQARKDLLSIQQGFQKQQSDLDREFQNKWNAARDENEKAKLKQDYDLTTQQLRNQSLQIQNQYAIERLNQQIVAAQKKATGGGFASLFGGD